MTFTPVGLVFDLDGVIVDSEPRNAAASIIALSAVCGVSGVQPDDFRAGIGRGAEAYLLAAAEVRGFTITPEQLPVAVSIRQQTFLELIRAEPLMPFPGVVTLIELGFSGEGFRSVVATSSSRKMAQAMLESAGIPQVNLTLVCGDEVSRKKPDPELFISAANRIGIDPERCVVFEDAPDGVLAARRAHCRCVAVTNTVSPQELADADLVVDSLEKINMRDIRNLVSS